MESPISKYNSDLATRQFQINEWSFRNKLETLFVFQIIFIALTFMAVLTYLYSIGILNIYLLGLIGTVIVFLLAIMIANRASYTSKVRDKRFWNRRQFGYMDPLEPSKGTAEFVTALKVEAGILPAPGAECKK
jgi:hypothetical protein